MMEKAGAKGTMEVSNSEMQAFLDCRRRWMWSYYYKLQPKRESTVGPLPLGARVHKALEQGFSSPGRAEAMFAVLAASIEEDYPRAEAAGELEQFEKECELAVIMLQGFVDWAAEEGLDAGWEVVSHERVVRTPEVELPSGDRVVFKGKIDQLVRSERSGALWFRDWKTCQTLKNPTLHLDPQMRMYALLLALTEPDAVVTGAHYVMLRKVKRSASAKPPFYGLEEVRLSPLEMSSFWTRTIGIATEMASVRRRLEAGEDDRAVCPPRPNRDCSWRCPFFEACPMRDDGSDYERYLSDHFEVSDPYAYYDEDPNKETMT